MTKKRENAILRARVKELEQFQRDVRKELGTLATDPQQLITELRCELRIRREER